MPSPFPSSFTGTPINGSISAFPSFFRERRPKVITADVWAFLKSYSKAKLSKEKCRAALAYIDQGLEFFEAAKTPNFGSKPLLLYYSFLNVVKAFLLLRNQSIPAEMRHGIRDPKINTRQRLRFQGQMITLLKANPNNSHTFAALAKALGTTIDRDKHLRIVDILAQIPSIHRAYIRVSGKSASFVPIKSILILKLRNDLVLRLIFEKMNSDVITGLPVIKLRRKFSKLFFQVKTDKDVGNSEIWFESKPVRGVRRGIDPAIKRLSERMNEIGIWNILTRAGYRYYFSTLEPRLTVPPLVASFAAFFYLGSITRYKPYDFDRILSGGYSWVVSELLSVEPNQFLYSLASTAAEVDVVRPLASMEI